MLSNKADVLEVGFPIHRTALIDAFEYDGLGCRVDIFAEIFYDLALYCGNFGIWFVDSNCDITDNDFCIACMIVSLGRIRSLVTFQGVATVEKLADIASNVVGQNESAAWMIINELSHVKDQIVKNAKFATI